MLGFGIASVAFLVKLMLEYWKMKTQLKDN